MGVNIEALLDSCGAAPRNEDAPEPLFRKGQRVRDCSSAGLGVLTVLKVLERGDPENPLSMMGRFGGRYYAVNRTGRQRDGWWGRTEKDLEALEG